MSSCQVFEGYIGYILDEFDAGCEPNQILHALHSCGFIHIQLPAIVECLKQHGRIPTETQPSNAAIRQCTPRATAANTPQTHHSNTPQTPHDGFTLLPFVQANTSQTHPQQTPRETSSSPAVVDADISQTPHSNTQKTGDTALHWDTEADQFSLAAYLAGLEIGQIKAQLCKHGYVVTSAEVAASLISQGVEQNLRPWANSSSFTWDFQT